MSYTAEVKDGAADRFRAYTITKTTRSPTGEDHVRREREGKPMLAPGSRIRYDVEEVAFSGDVNGAAVSIAAKDVTVTRVVFYAGPIEGEAVVGSVDVNGSGDIAIALVPPAGVPGKVEKTATAETIDEAAL